MGFQVKVARRTYSRLLTKAELISDFMKLLTPISFLGSCEMKLLGLRFVLVVWITTACTYDVTAAEPYDLSYSVFAQDSVLYRWNTSEGVVDGMLVRHRFPPLELWETYLSEGLEAQEYTENVVFASRDSSVYGCGFGIDYPVLIPRNVHPYLTARIYADGLGPIKVWIQLQNDWISVPKVISAKGYDKIEIGLGKLIGSSRKISGVKMIAERRSLNGRLIVGAVQVTTRRFLKWRFGDRRPVPIRAPLGGRGPFESWPQWVGSFGDGPALRFGGGTVPAMANLMSDLLRKYSRYSMKDVSVSQVLRQHEQLLRPDIGIIEYLDGLEEILVPLGDTHFRVNRPTYRHSTTQLNDVVKFYRIDGRVIVSAVFSPRLQKVISEGDEVTAVDEMPIEDHITTRTMSLAGSTDWIRDRIVIERLLTKEDSVATTRVTFRRPDGQEYSIEHHTSDSLMRVIPKNFLKGRFHYKELGEFAYIRIGTWSEKTWPFFYSYIDRLKESKGLILDLRSNGGGDLSFCRIASCFVDKPSVIFSVCNIEGEGVESILLRPDPFFFYRGPVAVLVDTRTGCASELFVSAIKRYHKDTIVVGQSPTSGAVGFIRTISLPGGNEITFPEPVLDAYSRDLEGVGVQPDMKASFESYRDLAPYDDSLLDLAIEALAHRAM